jgi:hypothetical protein
VAAGAAQAQIKCWNEDGKRRLRRHAAGRRQGHHAQAPSAPDAPPRRQGCGSKDGAGAKRAAHARRGTGSEKPRRPDEEKAAEKAAAKEKEIAGKSWKIASAPRRAATSTAGSASRASTPRASGYFLDDAQIASEEGEGATRPSKDPAG